MMPFVGPQIVIPNIAGSPSNGNNMAANITSAPIIMLQMPMISYEVDWTGADPIGAISIQGSNTYSQNADGSVNNSGIWTNLSFLYNGIYVTSAPVSGNTGSGIIDIQLTAIYATRCVYTATSGTGALTVTAMGK